MKFSEFKRHFQHTPLILSRDAVRLTENPQVMRNQLGRWQKKGLLISLRKGVYVLNPHEGTMNADQQVIANRLYEPSYLSLEYALNFYGFIPEAVADMTSVTTRKTMRFESQFGRFIYQHVKPEAFRGFKKLGEQNSVFMAEPEKAVVDFLYLNLAQFTSSKKRRVSSDNAREIFEYSLRFQNLEGLNKNRLMELGKLFGNKKLMRILKILAQWIKEEQE